ncbi:MAG: ankyrin repeat domain-containing protein, partial [Candidatus Babeliaceae bacterium]|nr:ankyrin repeat domain-containing protein [Candidatus Babeliaceae bacterium]
MEKHVFFWLSIFYIYMLTGQLLLATGKRKKFSTHVDRDVIYTKNNVIKKDGCGWTPLHRATVSGNVNEVKQLFEIKPDLNAMTAKYKVTPLHLAVSISNKDIVQMFLDKNVDVNIGDSDGRTPLHWAACRGYKDIVQMLLKYGANVNTVDTDGRTPLHCAEKNGKVADLLGKAEKYYSQIKKCMLSG